MSSRSWRADLAVIGSLLLAAAMVVLLVAGLPGSSISAPGAASVDCTAAQNTFSIQNCNIPTLASVSDEFDTSASASNWTVVKEYATLENSAAFTPYSFGQTTNRYTFGGWRDGWFFTQPKPSQTGGTREHVGLYRSYSPTSVVTVYAQFSSIGPIEGDVTQATISFATSSTTIPSSIIGAGCLYGINASSIEPVTEAGTTGGEANTDNFPVSDTIILHKNGNDIHCWGITDAGQTTYYGTVTKVATYTRLWIRFINGNNSTGNGSALMGINYIRVVENQRFIP